jgi:hypothetical protein
MMNTTSSSPRPSKAIATLLTTVEKGFIGDSIKENEEQQRERDRQFVSEQQKEIQQRGVDFIHQRLDMGKLRDYLEWQQMMQDKYLFRNAEIRRSKGRNTDAVEEEKMPKLRFRQSDHQPLCPRFLSMDYPPGVRIKLRKKLEIERMEMKRVNPPGPELELLLPGPSSDKDKRTVNAKEVLGKLPQHKSVETWNPRAGGFPPRPALVQSGVPPKEEDGDESREQGNFSRNRKVSKRTKTIGWSDEAKYSNANSINLKRSLMHSAKGPGRTMDGKGASLGSDRRAMSASEPAHPQKESAIEKDLRLPISRPPRDHPVGHLLPHNVANREYGLERKFISDLIREAKQEAKNNPNIKTNPLVIYLP